MDFLKSKKGIIILLVVAVVLLSVLAAFIVSYSSKKRDYDAAQKLLNTGKYIKAVESFEALGGFKDSEIKVLEAKYRYVKHPDNYNKENTTTYSFLKSLSNANYRDSKEIYKSFYNWKAELVAINSYKDDKVTMQYSFSKYDPLIFHFKVSGGPPDAETKLYIEYTLPNGETGNYITDTAYKDGKTGWFGWLESPYNNPSNGETGTLECKIYDENRNLLKECQLTITN